LVVVLGTFGTVLAVRGFAGSAAGEAPRGIDRGSGLDASYGSIMDFSGPAIRSVHPPPRTVALTFDDGPDPTWTPQVLAELRRQHVPATFFLVGSQVLKRPDLVRSEVRAGHEIGVHTFRHVEIASEPRWMLTLDLALTQNAITGATGIRTSLFRPPYLTSPAMVSPRQADELRAAARRGYLAVLADKDSNDWARPGVAAIVHNALPTDGTGGIIQLHDGGGPRAQTLAALKQVIATLKQQQYSFVTVSQFARLSERSVVRRAPFADQAVGAAFMAAIRLGRLAVRAVVAIAVVAVALSGLRLAVAISCVAFAWLKNRRRRPTSTRLPPVSVLVPAHNEGLTIRNTVRAILGSDLPTVELIVIDDGSTDDTAREVEAADPDGRVLLIRRAQAGKAAALQAGLLHATHDIIVTVDADTVVRPAALSRLVEPFSNRTVGAVSGRVRVGNHQSLVGRWQHIEYTAGANLDRRILGAFGCVPTVPGALGAYRRQALEQAGGFSDATVAEDTDLTLAIGWLGWKVLYAPEATADTEAPASITGLWHQRSRWSHGIVQCVWKHRRSVVQRRRHRGYGAVAIPYLVCFYVALPLAGPLIDLLVLAGLFSRNPRWLVIAIVFLSTQILTAVWASWLDREPIRHAVFVPAQYAVYRQVLQLVGLRSVALAALGAEPTWRRAARTGALVPSSVSAGAWSPAVAPRTARPEPIRPPATSALLHVVGVEGLDPPSASV
jgi:cellulose synthase/poly-beta-1,6-N-acetylglucosamine synthase-like glycosyltransferase/peptidoglycan/xylan/chitin deacetylase (PgdA/CDA1 family)